MDTRNHPTLPPTPQPSVMITLGDLRGLAYLVDKDHQALVELFRDEDGDLDPRGRAVIDGVSTLATPQVRVTAKGLERLRVALSPQHTLVAGGAA